MVVDIEIKGYVCLMSWFGPWLIKDFNVIDCQGIFGYGTLRLSIEPVLDGNAPVLTDPMPCVFRVYRRFPKRGRVDRDRRPLRIVPLSI